MSGKNKYKNESGAYNVYGSTGIIGKTNSYTFEQSNILVARVGANAGFVQLVSGKYDVSDNTLIVNVKQQAASIKYIFYYLEFLNLNNLAKGGGQPLITATQLKNIEIMIPNRKVQDKIVEILNKFNFIITSLEQGLLAEIEARKKQYEYYRDKLLNFKELKVENKE